MLTLNPSNRKATEEEEGIRNVGITSLEESPNLSLSLCLLNRKVTEKSEEEGRIWDDLVCWVLAQ